LSNSLSKGIICHDQGRLTAATYYFYHSCRENNHPLAYYFLGMCLRHGFGISKNETEAFKCFQNSIAFLIEKLPIVKSKINNQLLKYAIPILEFDLTIENNSVVLEQGSLINDSIGDHFDIADIFDDYTANDTQKVGVELEIIKTLLPLPMYELGNSLLHGWGVAKSRSLAEKMYIIGARIGDLDSMLALIHFYERSFQTKQRKQSIVYWKRLAEKNGYSGYGDSWIWEKKYDQVGDNRDHILCGDDVEDLETVSNVINEYNEKIKLSKASSRPCSSCLILD
jgi:hypothetical protein